MSIRRMLGFPRRQGQGMEPSYQSWDEQHSSSGDLLSSGYIPSADEPVRGNWNSPKSEWPSRNGLADPRGPLL